jgi:hypothetical protein
MKTLLVAVLFVSVAAAAVAADSLTVALPEVRARRLAGTLDLDGVLAEPAWQGDAAPARFIQTDPVQAAEPSYPTIVQVLYDDDAIYVGAHMHDARPDSIVARLCRRDQGSRSDEFTVYLDPYHDRRSGYFFVISAAGTLRDGILYNDGWDDDSWDGVWQGRARIDSTGWTAEMRIPYSQLRFKKSAQYRWGVNFRRTLARRNEQDMVAYTPRNESGFVSRFPDLVGIEKVNPARAFEVRPYATTRGEFLEHPVGDPFNDGSRYVPNLGGDLKTGLGSKLTLNATINPDFGQVEVDPAVVNLSDVETTYPEKRPFFVEGSTNYDFGFGGANNYMGFNWPGPDFFYSRRVGRPPQVSAPSADYTDVPDGARILGAAKITGKIGGDWNLGSLQALTAREMADLSTGGVRSEAEVEPLTYYSVLRGQRDFDGGREGLGTISTVVLRHFEDSMVRDRLNGESFGLGLDGWTTLDKSRTWVMTGWMGASRVQGTETRLIALQRNSTHYLQRPDASRWHVDSTATSLTGYAGRFTLNKQQGSTTFNSALGFIDPLYDVNDLGLMSRADVVNAHVSGGYRWTDPDNWKRFANANATLFGNLDFDGNVTTAGAFLSGGVEFANYYSVWPRFAIGAQAVNSRLTRGGPLTISPRNWNGGFYLDTDGRKPLFYSLDMSFARSRSGGWAIGVGPGVQWKPAANLQLNVEPRFDRNHQDSQSLGVTDDTGASETFGLRYVFAQLDQTTVSAGIRLNWAFTPNTSLQLYAQPYLTSGNYFAYKQLARARSYAWEPLGSGVPTYDPGSDQVDIDGPAGGRLPFNPDFNFVSLRGNAVLRWEYMPGSTLFLVWTQDRTGYENSGEFQVGPSLDRLVDQRPNNIFLAKVTYYLNL